MAWVSVTFTREQLYELVWQQAVQRVAAQHGLSDVGLAKACRRHKIPVPGRGYWAKREHGHQVARPPLPVPPPLLAKVTFTRWQEEPTPPLPPEVLDAWRKGRPDEAPEPFRPGQVNLRHPLVTRTAELLAKRDINDRGVVPFVPGGLDVRVSPAMRPKALWLLQLVVERIEASGLEVRLDKDPERAVLRAFGESVPFGASETAHRAPNATEAERAAYKKRFPWIPPERMMKPSGMLRLRQIWSSGYEVFGWDDTPRRPIETRIEEFILALINHAWARAEQRRADAYREQVWLLWDRRRRSRETRIERLVKGAAEFEHHTQIKQFAAALEEFGRSCQLEPSLARWIKWAGLHARLRSPEARFLRQLARVESP
jgi:hypothetical protein